MFEIGQRVVCVKPAEEVWFAGIPPELCPKNVPGPHWTKAPEFIGLILEEIRNEPRFTTNGDNVEQAFWEGNFMPLDSIEKTSETELELVV